MQVKGFARGFTVAVIGTCISWSASAQETSDQLAQQLANPVANLISVPFQFNAAFGGGRTTTASGTRSTSSR